MPLTPRAIFNDVRNNDLDKSSALDLIIVLIENTEDAKTRLECIDILEKIKIKNKKAFKILENLLISDSNERIRSLSAKVLKSLFLEDAIPPMKWALKNESSLNCLISIITHLSEIESIKARTFLIKKVNEINKKKYKYNLKDIIEGLDIQNLSNKELAEILINYYIISSLKLKFGYVTFDRNKKGAITNLD
ncbi:MAG: HEAT repeat domain-containing protein, partial [Promethearchaeota archaeon]